MLSVLTLIVLEGHMTNVAIDHGMSGEVGRRAGALEQRHGGTGFDVFENLWGKENLFDVINRSS